MTTTLYIGSKQYSSWSMRPWLCLKYAKVDFQEVIIPLRTPTTKFDIAQISSSKKVPCLNHNGLDIWDSLAICEFVNELQPEFQLLPKNQEERAIIRSVISEMHSGFLDLRNEMPMDFTLRTNKKPSPEALINIERIIEIWTEVRKKYGDDGDFLFGKFTLADAFFAPVVSRFVSYGIDANEMNGYIKTIANLPIYQEWGLGI
jgi:glutathione S-transferase